VLALLADGRTHGGAAVERVDTHGAVVFLAGERAYKLKRAVVYPYMDYGSAERRRHLCTEEVRLNRRTAPGVYLGVAPVLRGEVG
jgi:aminoglycoside phosphotransferase family enzyme